VLEALRRAAPISSGPGQALNLWFLGAIFPLTLLIGYLPGWLIEQDLLLRLQAARSTREATKGGWWGLLLITVFIVVLPNLAAFGALVAYPPVGGAPPAAIGKDALGIIATLVQRLPLWASVFMLIGVVACQMSTIDTFANVSALAFSYDIVEPWLGQRHFSWKQRLVAARAISVLVLLLTLVLALFSTSLNDVYFISSGVLSACIAVPALFMFWRRTTRAGVLAAAVTGLIGSVGGYFFEMKFLQSADPAQAHYYKNVLPLWMHNSFGYNYVAAGVVFSAVTIVAVSLLTRKSGALSWKVIHAEPVDNFQAFLGQVYPEMATKDLQRMEPVAAESE
jgi:SSS family solute:Na+ symporter